jgi:NitT/TauT family transport system substrate-binding protein
LAIAYDIAQSREQAVAETPGKILIGYPTIAAGLPFFYAVEKGLFKEAGLDVEAKKFVNPQQIIEGMITGQLQGCSNGTPSGASGHCSGGVPQLLQDNCLKSNQSEVRTGSESLLPRIVQFVPLLS